MAMASQLAAAALLLLAVLSAAPPAHGQEAASAPAPAPAAPKTITAILRKAGQFTKFLQLLQSTREAEQITNQLKGKPSGGGGLTVLAPPDSAFSALPVGTLNSLSDQQKTSLVQFHVVSAALPAAQLETVSNPLRTQAGDTGRGRYPLNLTADGASVNVSTGVVNATLDATPLYAGDRLVVYQVSKVLLPWALYGPPVPAPAPAPAQSKEKKKAAADAVADGPVAETAAGNTTASEAARGTPGAGPASCVAVAVAAAIWWGM
ncbi:hypothetical protein BS78_09G063400 [Paspalum vaginatum]|nr:hypothetical protein BS78_09G063400 [Paspalum vaginatum]